MVLVFFVVKFNSRPSVIGVFNTTLRIEFSRFSIIYRSELATFPLMRKVVGESGSLEFIVTDF